jgi:hypothetical protein
LDPIMDQNAVLERSVGGWERLLLQSMILVEV